MNHDCYDALTRALTHLPSRRDVLRGLSGAGLGLAVFRVPVIMDAKKKRKRKKRKKKAKPAKPNAFGCLAVGDSCQNATQCCSGTCEGQQGKKKCAAHGTGTCPQRDPGFCEAGASAICNNSTSCVCTRTTAGSRFCGDILLASGTDCASCQKDADCAALGFPAGSACVPFATGYCAGNCASGMACMAPCGTVPPAPTE